MDKKPFYSIRMRAGAAGKHSSGAERLVHEDTIDSVVRELTARARGKATVPEEIVIHIERIEHETLQKVRALDMMTLNTPDVRSGRDAVFRILTSTGVSSQAVENAINHLSRGAAVSGGNMRGAIIMDSRTGERLEQDKDRGVRVSRFDWDEDTFRKIKNELAALELTHFRTYEALALATKVAYAPHMVAELCWSDDPDYTAGYVAARTMGYVRFPLLKPMGDEHGGRVFFVVSDKLDMDRLIHYLQREPVLIDDIGTCRTAIEPEEFFALD